MRVQFHYWIHGVSVNGWWVVPNECTNDCACACDFHEHEHACANNCAEKREKCIDQALLEVAQKVVVEFLKTFAKDNSEPTLKLSDISLRIQHGTEQCQHSSDGNCDKGCRWKKRFVLDFNVPSMDTDKNRVIACLIKSFIDDWHSVEGFQFNFFRGTLRVVSDNDDDAVETSTYYVEQNGTIVFDEVLEDDVFLPSSGGDNFNEEVEKKANEEVEKKAVGKDIVKYIRMLTGDVFRVCAKIWPPRLYEVDFTHRRLVLCATMKMTNYEISNKSDPDHFFWEMGREMENEKWKQELLTNANRIKDGFFKTFKNIKGLAPYMVDFHVFRTTGLIVNITVPYETYFTKKAMVIAALLAAFRYDYHVFKFDTFRLNCANDFELKTVIFEHPLDESYNPVSPTEIQFIPSTQMDPRDKREAKAMKNLVLTHLESLRGDVFKYMREMARMYTPLPRFCRCTTHT